MKKIIQDLKKLQLEELDKLIFLFENELIKEYSEESDSACDILRKIREGLKNEKYES